MLEYMQEKNIDYKLLIVGTANTEEQVNEIKEMFKDDENVFILSREDTDSYKDKVDLILKEKSNLKYNLKDFKYDLEDIIDKWEQILNE